MTTHTASKQRFQMPASLATAQPWVRDQYSTLRTEAGPRWEHAKTVVVPVFTSTTAKIREDYLPAAAQATSRLAAEATRLSAPYRAEMASRGVATVAAVRGEVTADDVAALRHHGRGRTVKVISAAAIVGAATSAGVLLWQRTHNKPWDADGDELVESVLGEPEKGRMASAAAGHESSAHGQADSKAGSKASDDDPADPDGGAASSSNGATSANGLSNGSTMRHAKGKAGM